MRRLLPSLLVTVALLGAFSLTRLGAEEPPMSGSNTSEIQVGDVPGGFALNDHDGKGVRLGHGKDHGWFVLAFYPKASTGGCTKEVCSLRDGSAPFTERKVARYGISIDDVVAQKKFHTDQKLDFALLSDPDGSVSKRFKVLPDGAAWTQRVTFVVDPSGKVRHVDRKVNVGTHAADLLPVIDGLMKADTK